MNIAIALVHNKSDSENIAQINSLKSLLTEVVDGPFLNQETGESWTTKHHEIKGLGIPHAVKVYQVVPFGVVPPTNRYEINSGGIVEYGPEFSMVDKTFFDWGLKRGLDHGGDVFMYIENISKLKFRELLPKIEQVADKTSPTNFLQEVGCKIANIEYLKKGGLKNG